MDKWDTKEKKEAVNKIYDDRNLSDKHKRDNGQK